MVGILPLQGRYIIFFAGAEHYCLREEYHFQFKPEWVNLFMILNNVELLRVVVKYIVLEIHCRTSCILSYVYVSI